eukprot:2952875-Pyramimonas_sp.AAC.1
MGAIDSRREAWVGCQSSSLRFHRHSGSSRGQSSRKSPRDLAAQGGLGVQYRVMGGTGKGGSKGKQAAKGSSPSRSQSPPPAEQRSG